MRNESPVAKECATACAHHVSPPGVRDSSPNSPLAASVSSQVNSTMVFFSSYCRSSTTMFLVAMKTLKRSMRRRCMMRMRIVMVPADTKTKYCRKRVDAKATRPQKKMEKTNHTICRGRKEEV